MQMIMAGILILHANQILPPKDPPINVAAHFQHDSHFQRRVALEDVAAKNRIVLVH